MSDAQQAVEQIIKTMIEGWNQHNAQCFASIFAEDAEFTNVFGMVINGRWSIATLHNMDLPSPEKLQSLQTALNQ
jgi:uncharacterized protein (TIGR02246 family)